MIMNEWTSPMEGDVGDSGCEIVKIKGCCCKKSLVFVKSRSVEIEGSTARNSNVERQKYLISEITEGKQE